MTTESMKARLTALIDKDYIREINALIPLAEKFANQQFGNTSPFGSVKVKAAWAAKWTLCFIQKRERLYREKKETVEIPDYHKEFLLNGKLPGDIPIITVGKRHPNDFDAWPSNEQMEAFKRGVK